MAPRSRSFSHYPSIRRLVVACGIMAILTLALAPASAFADSNKPGVFPPGVEPYGQSYGEWAVEWWQWALSQPEAANPVLDTTGAQCAKGQRGQVWFLAGSFDSVPVTRTCTVPAGKALLIPVLNLGYFAFPDDPPATRTEAYVRAQVSFMANATNLTATIDDVSVANIKNRYFEESPLFKVILPANNVFRLPAGFHLDPSVDAGYYLVVKPLASGEHTIHFTGHFTGAKSEFSSDITYFITVARSQDSDGDGD
jgi:hypothetical protein